MYWTPVHYVRRTAYTTQLCFFSLLLFAALSHYIRLGSPYTLSSAWSGFDACPAMCFPNTITLALTFCSSTKITSLSFAMLEYHHWLDEKDCSSTKMNNGTPWSSPVTFLERWSEPLNLLRGPHCTGSQSWLACRTMAVCRTSLRQDESILRKMSYGFGAGSFITSRTSVTYVLYIHTHYIFRADCCTFFDPTYAKGQTNDHGKDTVRVRMELVHVLVCISKHRNGWYEYVRSTKSLCLCLLRKQVWFQHAMLSPLTPPLLLNRLVNLPAPPS